MAENNPENIEKMPNGKKKKKLLLTLIIGLLLVTVVGATYAGTVNKKTIIQFLAKEETFSAPLENFVVNLAEANFRRYLKITLVLEFNSKKLQKELQEKNYQVRDAVINLLSSKTVEDVNSIAGREKLKDELKNILNAKLEQGEVKNLYWTDFVVQ